jgi:hypothetical protein
MPDAAHSTFHQLTNTLRASPLIVFKGVGQTSPQGMPMNIQGQLETGSVLHGLMLQPISKRAYYAAQTISINMAMSFGSN